MHVYYSFVVTWVCSHYVIVGNPELCNERSFCSFMPFPYSHTILSPNEKSAPNFVCRFTNHHIACGSFNFSAPCYATIPRVAK